MSYNYYRKRHYNRSKKQNREYAQQMDELWLTFQEKEPYKKWSLSAHMDSAYFYDHDKEIKIRLSNHSADNQYHDLHDTENQYMLINIQSSKLDFIKTIDEKVPIILSKIEQLDLSNYRFINVTKEKINCYYKNYKTKRDSFNY